MNMTHNIHHSLWSKREYNKRRLPYLLRNHPVMQHRIPVTDHNELHANIYQPRVISDGLARIALQFLSEQPEELPQIERYYRLTDRFDYMSRKIGSVALEAGYFYDHLDMQTEYLDRRIS